MITHQLNHEELVDLLQEHKFSFSDIQDYEDHSVIINHEDAMYAYVSTVPSDYVVIGNRAYDAIMEDSKRLDYTPMFIVGTSEGIYSFNLELIKLKFEPYSDPEAGFAEKVAELPLSSGTRLLEWYPDFSNEAEYLDALMSDNSDIRVWDDGDSW